MLILKAYVNKDQIDEIWIHNVGVWDEVYNVHEYRIRKPEGYDHLPVYHKRDLGWQPLARKVLEVLQREEKKDA